ncbi:MAG TPA: DUF4355 domain-containing protein [Intrasporangiaceae bacterium]|nr:DUF4355 domain-containing protein [Intrasporangiaceae bacterium]
MSETTTTPAEPTTSAATAPDDLGDAGKKALEAERRARTAAEREAKELRTRLEEHEAAQLSELERAKKEADTYKAELLAVQSANLRQRIALEKGLPLNLVDRLRGDTEQDIAADADALMALVNAPRTPSPDPTQGPQGGAPTTPEQEFVAFTSNL